MKKKILYIIFLWINLNATAQETSFIPDSSNNLLLHNTCATALKVCSTGSISEVLPDYQECLEVYRHQYFKFHFSGDGALSLNTYNHTGTYTLYGPMSSTGISSCQQISLGQVNQTSGALAGLISISHNEGYYILRVNTDCIPINKGWEVNISVSSRLSICEEGPDCIDCISSFSPGPGKYIISAWVKGEYNNRNTSYENPGISVAFVGAPDSSYFTPSGIIIDDWQRIDGLVTVPVGATDIRIGLYCQAGSCSFDDIRFVPEKASMISYVYDPVTLKLVAQLDERNYATLYEYDEEGKLIRVKKETERGIMTIQENRDNIRKR